MLNLPMRSLRWSLAVATIVTLGTWLESGASAGALTSEAASAATPSANADEYAKTRKKRKKKKKKKKRRRLAAVTYQSGSWEFGVDASAATNGGGMMGHGTLRQDAAFLGAETEIEPQFERGLWRGGASIKVDHRETQGASLRESKAYGEVELGYRRSPRLRVTGEARIGGVWRPEWPDQYQPLPDGGYATTDRYSHWDRRAGVTVAGIPRRHHHARARYRYSLVDYREDPSYDPVEAPTHLVPGDHGEHEIDLSWRYLGRGWKLGGALDGFRKDYFFTYARDAGTGRTHAGAGGPPPNPLQSIRGAEPQLTGELTLAGTSVEIDAGYGYEIVEDVYQGYYSYTGHHPSVAVSWKPDRATELEASGEIWWRTYGPNSYAAGGDHPPLLYGDRRVDRRARAGIGLRRQVARHLTGMADVTLRIRRTNFPGYEPGVFPSTREYDIDWRYDNWLVALGIQYRL